MNLSITKKEFFSVTLVFILTRAFIVLISLISFAIFPQNGETYYRKKFEDALHTENVWDKFDSGWYRVLAKDGYPQRDFTDDRMETWGFMPLYPMTIKIFSYLFNNNYFWTGVILSNIFSFAAILVIFKLLKEKFKQGIDTIILILTCAGSFYLSIVYAEGLFILLSSLVFYLSFKKKYALALIFAGLCTVTRIQGCLLFLVPAVEILITHKKNFYKYIPVGIISFLPLLGFMFYLNSTCGEPLAFLKIQNAWGSKDLYPLQGFLGLLKGDRPITSFVNIMFWLVSLGILFSKYKYLPVSYLIFTFAYFMLSTSNEVVYGTTRYILGVIPVFVAASMSNKYVYQFYLIMNVLFLSLTLIAFVTQTGTFI